MVIFYSKLEEIRGESTFFVLDFNTLL